jgi:DNA invertase Pin-like site-specific DNA recombinase
MIFPGGARRDFGERRGCRLEAGSLARSLRQLIDTTALLNERDVELHSLTENINAATPRGKLTFHIFAAFAEFEGDILRQR